MTALTAHKAARPALLRSWREPVWRDQDYWPWLLVILGALLVIRLLALYFAKTDLFFDEAQYWSWSRDLAFGYFSKPPLIAWLIRLATEICGDAEWCVRAPSPILYTVTSHLPVSRRPRALRRPHRLLVGGGIRHAAGGFLLLAADLHRRSAHSVAGPSPSMAGSG